MSGGNKQQTRTPVEAPDSLHSTALAQIIDLLAEGEIEGFAKANPLECVYLNETPIANPNGTLNFQNISVQFVPGTQTQTYLRGFNATESEGLVQVELGTNNPVWTRDFNNLDLSAVAVRLSTPRISRTDTTTGDVKGYRIDYKIELSVDNGNFYQVLASAIDGKATTKYERRHRIDLPRANSGWRVRVTRVTPKQTTDAIQDTMYVEAVTEIVDGKFRMPMSAATSMIFDSKQFNNIPSRIYHLKGRIIRVPVNYDPVTRAYNGIWNGTYQLRYSDNPAWVFLDICTNKRYGLGNNISDNDIDKWALYKIARYCDELVSDGRGGMEPRHRTSLILQSQGDAHRVLQDMASMFDGILYNSGGVITPVADMPADPTYTYVPANVVEGRFTYSSSSAKVRHTVALVSWNDPEDFGRSKVEYVDDPEGVQRFGVQVTQIIAFGCRSRSEAHRRGRQALVTEKWQTNVVDFEVGLDGKIPAPGMIVSIADPTRAGARMGGRMHSATATTIEVDMAPTVDLAGARVTVISPTGTPQVRNVAGIAGNTITVTAPFDAVPVAQSVWLLETTQINAQQFRVLAVTEKDQRYVINALNHVPDKYGAIERDLVIHQPSITNIPSKVVPAPVNLRVTHRNVADQNTTMQIVTVSWDEVVGVNSYKLQWRINNGPWEDGGTVLATTSEIHNIPPGPFEFKVSAINGAGYTSPPSFMAYVIDPNNRVPGYVSEIGAAVAAAMQTAQNAAAAADKVIVYFWQETAPPIGNGPNQAREGDGWFDLSNNKKFYRVVNGVWVATDNDPLGQAVSLASSAQSIADGKTKLFVQDPAPLPSESALRDMWYQPKTGITRYYAGAGAGWVNQADNSLETQSANTLIRDGGFEAGGDGWTFEGGWVVEQSTNAALSGSKGIVHPPNGIDCSAYSATFPIATGEPFSLTAAVRNLAANGTIYLSMWFYDLNGDSGVVNPNYMAVNANGGIDAGGGWKRVLMTGIAPAGASIARVGVTVYGHTSGYWLADQFRIQKPEKLYGSGNNLCPNANFGGNTGLLTPWVKSWNPDGATHRLSNKKLGNTAGAGWDLPGNIGVMAVYENATPVRNVNVADFATENLIPVQPGKRYEWHVKVAAHRCMTNTLIVWHNAAGQNIGNSETAYIYPSTGGTDENNWTNQGLFAVAPAGATQARLVVRKTLTDAGQGDSYVWWAKPYFGLASAAQVEFTPWSEGPLMSADNAGTGQYVSPVYNDDLFDTNESVSGLTGLVRRVGLRVKGSRQTLGGARNSRASIVAGYTSVRTTTALTAYSTGRIDVNAHGMDVNGEIVYYNAVPNAITGLAVGTTVNVVTLDPYLDGGTRTYFTQTSALTSQQAGEGAIVIGNIQIPAAGSGGGGGGGGGGFECVDADTSYLACGIKAEDAQVGEAYMCYENGQFVDKMLIAKKIGYADCSMLVTDDMRQVIQSNDTPMTLRSGAIAWTTEMFGKQVICLDGVWRYIIDVRSMGKRRVVHLSFIGGDAMFFAGMNPEHCFATHNIQYKP